MWIEDEEMDELVKERLPEDYELYKSLKEKEKDGYPMIAYVYFVLVPVIFIICFYYLDKFLMSK